MWTVGIVNYNTASYIEAQLQILYSLNNSAKFNVIIVDNSNPSQGVRLTKNRYDNLTFIDNSSSKAYRPCHHHAEGLNIIKQNATTPYLLVHDPDFFWVKYDYLNWLQSLLVDNVVVGAPYNFPALIGKPDFPAAFGCAYRMEYIKDLDFDPYIAHLGYELQQGKDVGWKMRNALSNSSYLAFAQKHFSGIDCGDYSFAFMPHQYLYDNEVVAYHLFRGCHNTNGLIDDLPPAEWENSRKKYSDYFLKIALENLKNEITFSLRRF